MSYNSRLFHSVYRRARRLDEPYCPLELIPQRKSLYPSSLVKPESIDNTGLTRIDNSQNRARW